MIIESSLIRRSLENDQKNKNNTTKDTHTNTHTNTETNNIFISTTETNNYKNHVKKNILETKHTPKKLSPKLF